MSKTNRTPEQRIERRHDYSWPDGERAFSKVRFGPEKRFRKGQYFLLKNGREEFQAEKPPVSRNVPGWGEIKSADLLYRLPELLKGIANSQALYLPEGEADADALAEHGLVATTAERGAGEFGKEEAAWFEGAEFVVVLMDRDLPGAAGALRKVLALSTLEPAPEVHVYRAAVGKDVRDHLQAGVSLLQLVHVPLDEVAHLASAASAESYSRAGYSGWAA